MYASKVKSLVFSVASCMKNQGFQSLRGPGCTAALVGRKLTPPRIKVRQHSCPVLVESLFTPERIWQVLCCSSRPAGRGLGSMTHSNLQPGCPESWCPWGCRSLSQVVVGSQLVSETRVLVANSSTLQDGMVSVPPLATLECLR